MNNNKPQVLIKKPIDCSASELETFKNLVLDGGEVTQTNLGSRIKNAEILGLLKQNDEVIGIGALKKPNKTYKQSVFNKANASEDADKYGLELGWVFIPPSFRGKGFSHLIVEKLLQPFLNEEIFATSHENNRPMHRTLKKFGFIKHGKPYPSESREGNLCLFIKKS
jgi:predicted GNAT family N-acyltransferase